MLFAWLIQLLQLSTLLKLLQCQSSHISFKQFICNTCLLTMERYEIWKHQIFFLCHIMRNLQKKLNIIWQPLISRQTQPHFALPPPFLPKIFRPPPPPPISQFPSILKKKSTTSLPPPPFLPFTRGGRDSNYVNTMSMSSTKLTKFLKLQAKLNY